jgi:hypothetical protein
MIQVTILNGRPRDKDIQTVYLMRATNFSNQFGMIQNIEMIDKNNNEFLDFLEFPLLFYLLGFFLFLNKIKGKYENENEYKKNLLKFENKNSQLKLNSKGNNKIF